VVISQRIPKISEETEVKRDAQNTFSTASERIDSGDTLILDLKPPEL
jgi:hypothetical protein